MKKTLLVAIPLCLGSLTAVCSSHGAEIAPKVDLYGGDINKTVSPATV